MSFKKILNLVFVLCSMLVACNGDSETKSNTVFANNSEHRILITSYYHGMIMSNSEVDIAIAQSKSFSRTERGLPKGGTSYASYFLPDSIIVTYDGAIEQLHGGYKNTGSVKGINHEDPRNLLNEKNYVLNIIESKKRSQELEYVYTFTKDDYEQALK